MYLTLGQAAREAGVAKSTISKALASGKLSYREKNSDGYKIDPAELFRVFPKTSKTAGIRCVCGSFDLRTIRTVPRDGFVLHRLECRDCGRRVVTVVPVNAPRIKP